MKGLLIKDKLRWHDQWSQEIGKRLMTKDSTFGMIIFDERHTKEDLLAVVGEAPKDLYQVFGLEEAPQNYCDFMGDSGQCYKKLN